MKGYEEFTHFVLGYDHGAFELKEKIKEYLENRCLSVEDKEAEYCNPILYVQCAHKVCRRRYLM